MFGVWKKSIFAYLKFHICIPSQFAGIQNLNKNILSKHLFDWKRLWILTRALGQTNTEVNFRILTKIFYPKICLICSLLQHMYRPEALPAIFLLRCLSHVWVESHLSESNLNKKGDQKSMSLRHIPLFLIKRTLLAIDSDCLPKVCYLKVKKLRYLNKLR